MLGLGLYGSAMGFKFGSGINPGAADPNNSSVNFILIFTGSALSADKVSPEHPAQCGHIGSARSPTSYQHACNRRNQ